MYGNGWPGSNASGVRTGKMLVSKYCVEPLIDRRACIRPARGSEIALGGEQRTQRLRPAGRLLIHLLEVRCRIAASSCSVFSPSNDTSSMSARYFFRMVATRTMKNSSRFDAGDGEELHALEQRVKRVLRLREHALVELEPAQLTVDEECGRRQIGRVERRPVGVRVISMRAARRVGAIEPLRGRCVWRRKPTHRDGTGGQACGRSTQHSRPSPPGGPLPRRPSARTRTHSPCRCRHGAPCGRQWDGG